MLDVGEYHKHIKIIAQMIYWIPNTVLAPAGR